LFCGSVFVGRHALRIFLVSAGASMCGSSFLREFEWCGLRRISVPILWARREEVVVWVIRNTVCGVGMS
jgi:hypothetical protein